MKVLEAYAVKADFDLKKKISETDYAFSGTIINRKQFEITWTDEKGEKETFPRTILEVRVNNEYYGSLYERGDVIKVYYPYPSSYIFDDSILIKDNAEYVFIGWELGEKYTEKRKKANNNYFEIEKYADVVIGSAFDSLFPIEEGTIIVYNEYFSHNNEVMKKTVPNKSVKTDRLSSPQSLEDGYYIAFNMEDFEKSFKSLFKNSEKLPDAEELIKLRDEKNPKNSNDKELESVDVSNRLPLPERIK